MSYNRCAYMLLRGIHLTEFYFSDFKPTVGIAHKKNQTGLIVGIVVAFGSLGFILMFLTFYTRTKRDNDNVEGNCAQKILKIIIVEVSKTKFNIGVTKA